MKKLLPVVVLFLSVSAWSQNPYRKEIPSSYGYLVRIGQEVPGFEMELTTGEKVAMASQRGKVVMLQFTASWCGVCRREMPHIEGEIWKKYKNNPRFALYGIDLDEPLEKVVRFGRETGVTYPLALDPGGRIFYTFAEKGAGVTRNVIVNPEGRIVYMTRLFQTEEFEEMKKVIDDLMEAAR